MKSEELSYRSHQCDPAAPSVATGEYMEPLRCFSLISNRSDFISASTFIKDDPAREIIQKSFFITSSSYIDQTFITLDQTFITSCIKKEVSGCISYYSSSTPAALSLAAQWRCRLSGIRTRHVLISLCNKYTQKCQRGDGRRVVSDGVQLKENDLKVKIRKIPF